MEQGKEEAGAYWREADRQEDELLRYIENQKGGVNDEIQGILDRFQRLDGNGWLTKRETEALHRKIGEWQAAGGKESYLLRLYMQDLERRSRIRKDLALYVYLLAAMTLYYLDIIQQHQEMLFSIALSVYEREFTAAADMTGKGEAHPPDKKEIAGFLEVPMPDGTRYAVQMEGYAQYAARRLADTVWQRGRQGKRLDVDSPEVRQILTAERNRLLRVSKTGHCGYLDQVMTAVVGYTVMRVFRDSGVEKYQFIATLDEATTEACRSRHRKVYAVSGMKLGVNVPPICPPPHPCRSVIRAVASGSEQAYNLMRGAGKGETERPHSVRHLGRIDRSDEKAVQSLIEAFKKRYADSKTEHCLVITAQGEVYIVDGDKNSADTSLLGDKMKGSINIHNHPADQTQYSFSHDEDLRSFLQDGSSVMWAYDYKFEYEIKRTEKTKDLEEYNKLGTTFYIQALQKCSESGIAEDDIDFFIQHYRIQILCDKLGINYKRQERR